ncbi:MAG: thiaminase II [Chloroflexota bacterium]
MQFTQILWQNIEEIYQAILQLPFNQELMAGTLAQEKFEFYIYQDSLYLADYGRALAVLGSRSATPDRMLDFWQFAQNAIIVERALHEGYIKQFNMTSQAKHSPACAAYTNFLLATATHRSYEEGIAGVLPCFWIYREVGNYIYANAAPNNPYQAWIDTYAGEEFSLAVDKAIDITDETASQASESAKPLMIDAFVTSSRLEWMFWDSAYRMEQWQPIVG